MSTTDLISALSGLVALLGVIVAIIAMLKADRASREQNNLTQKQNEQAQKQNDLTQAQNVLMQKQGEIEKRQADLSEKANDIVRNVAKGDKIIPFWSAWKDVNDVDLAEQANFVPADFRTVINTLTLTAQLWNSDMFDKDIVFESYWPQFKYLCDKVRSSQIDFMGKPAQSYLTVEIESSYEDMRDRELKRVKKRIYETSNGNQQPQSVPASRYQVRCGWRYSNGCEGSFYPKQFPLSA